MVFEILYYASFIILIPGILFSVYASIRVNTTFNKYNKVPTQNNVVASDVAKMLIEKNSAPVSVQRISGNLTDNFNPQTNVLSLSDSTYSSNSVASVAVAAHEVGHVMQHQEGYKLIKFRSALVPVVNIGSRLALPFAILGVVLEYFSKVATVGSIFIFIGIVLYSLVSIFALITLPVEINASRRAKKMLLEQGFVTDGEAKQVSSVLYAAALTYFASLTVSLLYLLRFIILIAMARKKD
ncbi:MAG TPA: peptidase [Clostridiales bacterium]|nr:peptidase [Clostridiales bacterium]